MATTLRLAIGITIMMLMLISSLNSGTAAAAAKEPKTQVIIENLLSSNVSVTVICQSFNKSGTVKTLKPHQTATYTILARGSVCMGKFGDRVVDFEFGQRHVMYGDKLLIIVTHNGFYRWSNRVSGFEKLPRRGLYQRWWSWWWSNPHDRWYPRYRTHFRRRYIRSRL